jgi:hypothetical protein
MLNKHLFVAIAFAVLLMRIHDINGQINKVSDTDGVNLQPIDSVLSLLEKKNEVRFYYDTRRLDNKRLPLSLLDYPINELINRLEQITGCSWVKVNQNAFVYMPVEDNTALHKMRNGIPEVGNKNEYGKYKTATLSGTLSDGKTGEPLAGAIVSVKQHNIATSTDKDGHFVIKLPVGEHELEFSYFGYEHNSQKIKLMSNGTANFEIYEKPVNIEEVIVRAEKAESNVSLVGMSPIRLNFKTIKELPFTLGEKDILRSMTLLPGIQSVGEFGTGFNVRGGSSDQNLILIEDTPLFNSSHLFGLESIINPDGVSGVLLLKAGIPAQYGERASSVTSIHLGNNPAAFHLKGGIGLLSSRLSLETPLFKNKANLLLGGRTSYSDWLLHRIPDVELRNSKAGFFDLNALLNIHINANNKITLFGYSATDRFTYNTTETYEYGSILGTLRWLHHFNNRVSSRLISGISRYNYNFTLYNNFLPSNAYRVSSSLSYNSLKYSILLNINEKCSIDFGIDAVLYRSWPGDKKPYGSHSTVAPVNIDPEKGIEGAAYLSGNFDLTRKLGAEIGFRISGFGLLGPAREYQYAGGKRKSYETIIDTLLYSSNDLIKLYGGLEPRISLRYLTNDQSSLKLSYTRMNQYINLLSNTAVAVPSDVWKLSSTYISPLSVDQFTAGYFRNFRENSYETSVEVYYKRLQNIPEYRDGARLSLNENLETEVLNASGYNYGIEFYARKNTGKLTGWISYTWSASLRHTTSPVKEDQINQNHYFPSNYDKPHNLSIIANYYLTRRWHTSLIFNYSTGRSVTLPESRFRYGNDWLVRYSDRNEYRLPDYHRLDLSLTCDETLRIKKKFKGSWTLSIINVYGRRNAYSSFYKKAEPSFSNNYRLYSLYTLYIIGRPLPTITYNFTF